MPRYPRNLQKAICFHVITQGLNKSYIFEREEDIKYYIKTMYFLAKELKIQIISYCIMNNHAHMLLKINNIKDLSKYMQRLNTRYGKYFNKKYNRVGYVFRDRFKSEGIYSEKHLFNCIKYIYDNPVKAGMCKKACDYPFSNYTQNHKIFENFQFESAFSFLDVDEPHENNCKKIIEIFLTYNKISLNDIKKDKKTLNKLIQTLKNDYNISLREISKEIQIPRETLRRRFHE